MHAFRVRFAPSGRPRTVPRDPSRGPRTARRGRRALTRLAHALMLLCSILVLPACADLGAEIDRLDALAAQAESLRDDLRNRRERWEERAARDTLDDASRAEARAQASQAGAGEAALAAAAERLHALRDEAAAIAAGLPGGGGPTSGGAGQPPSGVWGAALSWVLPFVPEPVRTPLVLGGALVASVLRARQLRVAAASMARGIAAAMNDDPAFAESFRRHATTFRAIQTASAARIVDEATGKRRALLAI